MVLMEYNEKWRNIRKIMHQLLTAKQCEIYRPFQDKESRQLLWDYLREPEKFYIHNGRYANSVIMSVVFGKEPSQLIQTSFNSSRRLTISLATQRRANGFLILCRSWLNCQNGCSGGDRS